MTWRSPIRAIRCQNNNLANSRFVYKTLPRPQFRSQMIFFPAFEDDKIFFPNKTLKLSFSCIFIISGSIQAYLCLFPLSYILHLGFYYNFKKYMLESVIDLASLYVFLQGSRVYFASSHNEMITIVCRKQENNFMLQLRCKSLELQFKTEQ